ncbi:M64 family metallopeptidase [Chitinimonas sp.]|uniref:M64 family metallopeptidase n=1 Tax=Chitinimonas sp. TaxID=1934313 RepID=UPI002F932133
MKHLVRVIPALLSFALAGPSALAAEQLLLRIKQQNSGSQSSYSLIHAEAGSFAGKPQASTTSQSDIVLIGRDASGHELFRSRVRNPAVLHAEAFDPASGQIAHAQDVLLPQAYFEASLPDHPALDHIELQSPQLGNERMQALRTPQRFERQTLDRALKEGRMRALATTAVTSTVLYESGPSANRMDIVLIGDGYTSAEMAKWASDAQKVANGLLADPLFAAHKSGLNIRRVDIASNQSGVDEPLKGQTRDTALGMVVGCYNIDRLVCADENLVYAAVGQVTAADARDVIVAIANTTTYGGAGGEIATMTMHASAIELALHEIGHTAFALADEYDYGTCNNSVEPSQANATRQTSRASIKWGSLIAASTTVPTPLNTFPVGTVGLFTGAKYCTSGLYRPTQDSRMRTLGKPWYAVNEQRANVVFSSYSGSGGDTNPPVTATGTLAAGAVANLPSGSYLTSNQGGNFQIQLSGPANADFDLALYRWNGSAWVSVATAAGPSSGETLNYAASAGYYYIEVKAYSGSGSYTAVYTAPK